MVGYFNDGSGNHGFLDTNGIFTTINNPSATGGTVALGINAAGQVIGYFNNSSGNQGFLDIAGVFTTIDVPAPVEEVRRTASTMPARSWDGIKIRMTSIMAF